MRVNALVFIAVLFLISTVSASYTQMANVLTYKTTLGLLFPLGIENWVSPADAIMYYNYIAITLICTVAAFAGQSNESRFTVFVPFFAAFMIFIGWLQAPNPSDYWGMIIACMLLGILMYMNDMNHEKSGLPGPGSKWLTVVFMIIIFEASVTLMSTQGLNPFPDLGNSGMQQQSLTCGNQQTGGYGYQCDDNGKIMMSASIQSMSNTGGANIDVASYAMWALQALVGAFMFIVKIIAAVVLFSAVMIMAYPALGASPQALLIMGVLQVVIWAIYAVAYFNLLYKPSFETAQV